MKKAPPQTPPGKHIDPQKKDCWRDAVPRMRCGCVGVEKRNAVELVTKARTNEKVVRESGGEQLLKGYRGEIAQRLMNTASVVEQQVFRNRI